MTVLLKGIRNGVAKLESLVPVSIVLGEGFQPYLKTRLTTLLVSDIIFQLFIRLRKIRSLPPPSPNPINVSSLEVLYPVEVMISHFLQMT